VRVTHRDELVALLKPVFMLRGVEEWLAALEAAGIPCGPINTLDKVFAEPQVSAREMLVTLEHPTIGDLPLVGSPLKFSQTPVEYRLPPPRLGEHTDEILRELHGQGRKLTTETTEL
jgi:crotonobetainyl-CoA:carnitine CoA-transferase CaiB-like acyl-CoA transferase